MLRLFLTAAMFFVGFLAYGLIAHHDSFWNALRTAGTFGFLILIIPFIATK